MAGKREGLDWVLVEPRGMDADFRRALFGFDQRRSKRMISRTSWDRRRP